MSYAVPPALLDASPEIFPWDVDGRRVFVKKKRPNKHAAGKWVQRWLYRLFPNPLVMPSGQPPGGNVAFESSTFLRLRALGAPVPEVLHVEDGYFVMSDAGPSLQHLVRERRDAGDPEGAATLADEAARALGALHDLGVAHGGALIRNLTWKDGRVHFIDMEEDVPPRYLDHFQLRDLFLLLFSMQRNGVTPSIPRIASAYDASRRADASRPPTLDRMRALLRSMRVARRVECPLLNWMRLRDIRALAALVRQADADGV